MNTDKKMTDEQMVAKIAAKVLDQIKGSTGTVCQGYYCDSAGTEMDSAKQWTDVLNQHKIKLDDAALNRVSALPLTQDEIVQAVIELKTADRSTKTVSEKEAQATVQKVLADNVIISRNAGGKTKCSSSGPHSDRGPVCVPCGPSSSGQVNHCGACGPNGGGQNFFCQPCGPSSSGQVNHCGACGPNGGGQNFFCTTCGPNHPLNTCAVCGPNNNSIGCAPCGPNSPLHACSVCGPTASGHFYEECKPGFDFGGGGCVAAYDPQFGQFDPRDILRLSEQVAALAAEIQKLKMGK